MQMLNNNNTEGVPASPISILDPMKHRVIREVKGKIASCEELNLHEPVVLNSLAYP